MVDEIISYLAPEKLKTYVDCTFGQGGYSKKILENTNCIQLHLCKHRVDISKDKCLAIDAHDIPCEEITEDALKLCKKYSLFICFQY